jgi:hypothetical protein
MTDQSINLTSVRMVCRVVEMFGSPDLLVANAGIFTLVNKIITQNVPTCFNMLTNLYIKDTY